jgi:hypothetical protein
MAWHNQMVALCWMKLMLGMLRVKKLSIKMDVE